MSEFWNDILGASSPANWKCAKCGGTFDPLANARRDPRTAQNPASRDYVCIPCYRELRPNGL